MYRIWDRVKFQSTANRWRNGTVVELDGPGRVGVRFDDDLRGYPVYIEEKFLTPIDPYTTRNVRVIAVKRGTGGERFTLYLANGKILNTPVVTPVWMRVKMMRTGKAPFNADVLINPRGTVSDIRV